MMPVTVGHTAGSGRPPMTDPVIGVGADRGPTSPCKGGVRIAGCKGRAEFDRRLTGDTHVHGTVGVHTRITGCAWVKRCVRGGRTTRPFRNLYLYTMVKKFSFTRVSFDDPSVNGYHEKRSRSR